MSFVNNMKNCKIGFNNKSHAYWYFDNYKKITGENLVELLKEHQDYPVIHLGNLTVKGDVYLENFTFEGDLDCGEMSFLGHFCCGKSIFKGEFFGSGAFFKSFDCENARFEYFSTGHARFNDFNCGNAVFKRFSSGGEFKNFNFGNARFEDFYNCKYAKFGNPKRELIKFVHDFGDLKTILALWNIEGVPCFNYGDKFEPANVFRQFILEKYGKESYCIEIVDALLRYMEIRNYENYDTYEAKKICEKYNLK